MPLLRSIQAKVVLVIILVLSVSVAASITITVTSQREAFLDETSRNLAATSSIINNVVRNTMIVGEAPITIQTIQDIQGIGDFQEITIYRRDGTTAFHDETTIREVNTILGREGFATTPRLPLETIDNPHFDQVVRTNTPELIESIDEQRVDYYFPILNYAECRVCHGNDEFIRGVAHFQVSTASVFAQISSTQNTLTLFFVGTGVVLALVIVLLMRGIVLDPLFRLRSTVAEVGRGNLETEARIGSHDELGELASSINAMIAGLKDRERLELQNQVIEARNEENRKYLDNINEGLLLLNGEQVISDQYSSFLEELFGTPEIAGRRFSEFIYPGDEPASERRREIDQFVDLVFTSITTDMEMIASINPLSNQRLTVGGGDQRREIVVDASFQRIMEEGSVRNVMVIFVDKTRLVEAEEALERERERSATEQEQIAAILRSGPEAFQEFAEDARRTLGLMEQHVDLQADDATLGRLFRELHSLKGAARYMELRAFARSLNDLEELVAAVRDGQREASREVTSEVETRIDALNEGIADIRRITERFREFAQHDGDRPPSGGVRGFFDNLERMATSLAEELDKQVRLRTATDYDTLPVLAQLRNPIIHLVRNALDHGIEESLERISVGKPEHGTIVVTIARDGDERCRIEVRDDGRGIDFDAVARSARRLGLVSSGEPSRNELLKALFHPRFSSREQATEVSGRGVGLDAVQDAVQALHGSIAVATREGVGTRFTIRVPATPSVE
ncbi:MAG: ATP-binding protein [Spirochaetota bacterium]